jgi:hypothetical protein
MADRAPAQILEERAAKWRRAAAICWRIGAACGLVAASLYLLLTLTGSRTHAAGPAVAARSAPPIAPHAPKTEITGQQDLALPPPTGYTGGVLTGYPRSTAGATAAAYGYSRIASGLDVEGTLQAIQSISDPASGWFTGHRAAMADSLVAQRRGLGLPPQGPAGMAQLTVEPASYRIEHVTADSATVLTLNILSAESAEGTMTSGTLVLRWVLHWNGSRWLVTAPYSSAADDRIAVTPLTSAAESVGWKVARGG